MTEPVLKRVRKIRKVVLHFPYNNFIYGDLRGWVHYDDDICGEDGWRWRITHRNYDKANVIALLAVHRGIEDAEAEAVKKVEFGLKFIHEHRRKIFRWSRQTDARKDHRGYSLGDLVMAQDDKGRPVVIRRHVPDPALPGVEMGKEVVKHTECDERVLKRRFKNFQSAILAVKL